MRELNINEIDLVSGGTPAGYASGGMAALDAGPLGNQDGDGWDELALVWGVAAAGFGLAAVAGVTAAGAVAAIAVAGAAGSSVADRAAG